MKKRLYILRHAKAEASADHAEDHARPLAPKGLDDATRLGAWLAEQPQQPQQILCSTSERTRQTQAALGLDAPVAYSDRLYLASAREMLTLIHNTATTTDRLMLVTHNGGAHELVVMLTGDATDDDFDRLRLKFPPCALAILTFDGDWTKLTTGQCTIEKLIFPDELT